jgi:hypothetical protein
VSVLFPEKQLVNKQITIIKWEIQIRVIQKLPNSPQYYKGEVKTHKYIDRQNPSTTGNLWKLRA